MNISEKIKKLRQDKGWSQTQLAQKLGIPSQNVSRYERGVFTPATEALAKFAEVFGVSVDYLLSEELEDAGAYKIKDKQLQRYFEEIDKLSEEDKNLAKGVLEAILIKSKVKDLTSDKML
ncbi:MAG TPA: helix-turn-helix transcriptional regulator [Bacillota bacterium]|nr:helix-turn-helix transcriptional regulator [Bacillota bacterium]